jgi:hypothetical protein
MLDLKKENEYAAMTFDNFALCTKVQYKILSAVSVTTIPESRV